MRSSLAAALRWLVLPWGATSGNRIILDSDDGSIKVYEGNTLVAEMGFAVGPANNEPGFITWDRSGTGYYTLHSDYFIQFGNVNAQGGNGPDVPAYIEVGYGPGLSEPSTLRLGSGFIGPNDFASALVELVSGGDAARPRPKVTVLGSGSGATANADLAVTGFLTSGTERVGRATISVTVANTPVSATVTYPAMITATLEAFATVNSANPLTAAASVTTITTTSATVWLNRTTVGSSVVHWQVKART